MKLWDHRLQPVAWADDVELDKSFGKAIPRVSRFSFAQDIPNSAVPSDGPVNQLF